jgi:ubiquinone/menaquinone biosynthesis C-methylase UbiE
MLILNIYINQMLKIFYTITSNNNRVYIKFPTKIILMKNENALDLFSTQGQGGDTYEKYRPPYHPGLIDKLNELSKGKKTYLDIAAGTGQIFLKIFTQFSELAVANDLSNLQLSILDERLKMIETTTSVKVICCDAFELSQHIPDQKYDIITIAAAFHWFDQDKLLKYIRDELLNPDGEVFIISYSFDDLFLKTKDDTVGMNVTPFYHKYKKEIASGFDHADKIVQVLDSYKNYDFKKFFENVEYQEWKTVLNLTVEEYVGFLKTWSMYPNYIKNNKDKPGFKDPTVTFVEDLIKEAGTEEFMIDMPATYYYYVLSK